METQFLLSEQVYARAKVFSVLSDDRTSQITILFLLIIPFQGATNRQGLSVAWSQRDA